MQDFTKLANQEKQPASIPNLLPNKFGGMYDRPKMPKQGFIAARFNTDNFWNLVFFFGISLSAKLIDFVPTFDFVVFLLIITVVPYFLANLNKVTCIEGSFFSKSGRNLDKNLPKHLFWVIFLIVPFSIQAMFAVDKTELFRKQMSVYLAIILFIPTLYFILRNCPISILFNKKAWTTGVTGLEGSTYDGHHGSSVKHSSPNKNFARSNSTTDLGYSSLRSNVHNSRRYR